MKTIGNVDEALTKGTGSCGTAQVPVPMTITPLPVTRPTITLEKRQKSLYIQKNALPLQHEE